MIYNKEQRGKSRGQKRTGKVGEEKLRWEGKQQFGCGKEDGWKVKVLWLCG